MRQLARLSVIVATLILAATARNTLAGTVSLAWDPVTDSDLAGYRGRMPERVLRQVRAESIARRVTTLHGLPRFSLFGL